MDPVSLFSSKLKNIHTVLMQAYENTNGFTTPVQGDEREVVIRELLALVLPQSYRLGKGPIIDSSGAETGQVDAVFEKPFSLSFPISSDTNRLYLADSVAAAFEIKSNLYQQADASMAKVAEIKTLLRKPTEGPIILYDEIFVPVFVIGFKGYKKIDSVLEKFFPNARAADQVNGVLIIEDGVFVGHSPMRVVEGKVIDAGYYEIEDDPIGALLCFFSCLSDTLRHLEDKEINLLSYSGLLKR